MPWNAHSAASSDSAAYPVPRISGGDFPRNDPAAIAAISGASGAVYGTRLLQVLRETAGVETHLVVSEAGWRNIEQEADLDRTAIERLAHHVHDVRDASDEEIERRSVGSGDLLSVLEAVFAAMEVAIQVVMRLAPYAVPAMIFSVVPV